MTDVATPPTAIERNPLGAEELALIDAYWRAANYLSVGQIYLLDNHLLREALRPEQIKPRLLGRWGTSPGLNLVYVHMNRLIRRDGHPFGQRRSGPRPLAARAHPRLRARPRHCARARLRASRARRHAGHARSRPPAGRGRQARSGGDRGVSTPPAGRDRRHDRRARWSGRARLHGWVLARTRRPCANWPVEGSSS